MGGARTALASLAAVGTLLALTGAPALAQSPSPGAETKEPADLVVLSGRVTVDRGEALHEVVVVRGRVHVAGVVTGDVVVLDGPIQVTGQVSGSVVALDGQVVLGSTAQVGGDVLAGGEVTVGVGATVEGDVRRNVRFAIPLEAVGRLVGWLAVAVSTLLLGIALLLLAPRALDRVHQAATTAPVACGTWGLATAILVPAVGVALLPTVLGIPLGLSLLLAIAPLAFLGDAWAAFVLGRMLVRHPRPRVLAFGAGWAILRVVGLVPVVSGVAFALGSVFGTGAAVVALWRARGRDRAGRHRPGYAPPDESRVGVM
jgi:hypothetical protein